MGKDNLKVKNTGGPEKGRLVPPWGTRPPLSRLEGKLERHPVVVKRATKAKPLLRVRILVVRDHPEGTINRRVANAANPGLDQLDLVADRGKDGMEGKDHSQPIPKMGDALGVHETQIEPSLDQLLTDWEKLRHHNKAASVSLRLVNVATSNVLHDLLQYEERERGKWNMISGKAM